MKKYIGELNEKVTLEALGNFLESNNFYKTNTLRLRNSTAEKGHRELNFYSHPKFKNLSEEAYDLEVCHDYPAEKNRTMNFSVFFSLRGRGVYSDFFFPLKDYKVDLDSDMVMGDLNEKFCEIFDKQLELIRYSNVLSRFKPKQSDVEKLIQNIILERLRFPCVTQETEDSIQKKSIKLLSTPPKDASLLTLAYFIQREVYFSDEAPISYERKDSNRIIRAGWASLVPKRFMGFMFKINEIIDDYIKKNKI